jgi:hypothetical protein
MMRPNSILIIATATAIACATLAGPAGTALADPSSPQQTIDQLEASGYTVNIDRVGSAPLSQCVVTSVRNPQIVTQWVRVWDGKKGGGRKGDDGDWDLVEIELSRSISVSLNCAR